jgi:alcohol dehydrogenase (cytochrome c)
MKKLFTALLVVVGLAVVAVVGLWMTGTSPLTLAGLLVNGVRSARNPTGTFTVEAGPARAVSVTKVNVTGGENWTGYNNTLTSERFSPLQDINASNAGQMKVLCSFDTHLRESFETAPIMVSGSLIFTTAYDIYSIDPSNCRLRWHVHEVSDSNTKLTVNRGVAYLDGRIFRGALDGAVSAYDFQTGKRLWSTKVADWRTAEVLDSAPIAWNGMVFIGDALGDYRGVKGRMYALSAKDGHIVWETYLVPKAPGDPVRGPQAPAPAFVADTWANRNAADVPISGGGTWTSFSLDPATGHLFIPVGNPSPDFVSGLREGQNLYTDTVLALDATNGAYVHHYSIAPQDWHDWDVSNTPAILTTRGGRKLLSFAPKNGFLYSFDLSNNQLVYKSPVTHIENIDAPLSTTQTTRFCPGAVGGGEWNGVAYDPQTNLIFTGEDEWCTSVKTLPAADVKAVPNGQMWMGHKQENPLDIFGTQDPHSKWAGWLYATDADSGQYAWRIRTNYPIVSGVTATGGGIVLFGDMGGNFYAVDAATGKKLWGGNLGAGAIGGGVITYSDQGSQKIAVAAGLTSFVWPTADATAKVVVLGVK